MFLRSTHGRIINLEMVQEVYYDFELNSICVLFGRAGKDDDWLIVAPLRDAALSDNVLYQVWQRMESGSCFIDMEHVVRVATQLKAEGKLYDLVAEAEEEPDGVA